MRLRPWLAMRAKVQLAYPGDLVFHVLSASLVTAVGVALVLTIFHHVPDVRGWTVHEVLLSWGFAEASLGLFLVVFRGLYVANQRYVVGGELDRLLLRPADPYLQILLEHLDPQALPLVFVGLGIVGMGAIGGVPWGLAHVALVPVFVVGGALVVGGMLTALSAIGFWTLHRGTAVGIAWQVTSYGKYPLDFLPGPLAVLFTLVPIAFVGFLPATFYMDRPEWAGVALAQPVVGVVSMALGYAFWRLSLRRYASTGS